MEESMKKMVINNEPTGNKKRRMDQEYDAKYTRIGKNFDPHFMKSQVLVAHPQANGQAEVANRIIINGLKKGVERSRNTWMDELLHILGAYRTTYKVTTEATPFMLSYGAEVVVPLGITQSSSRVEAYEPETNEKGMRLSIDLIDEVRDEANARNAEHQQSLFYYNRRVKERFFQQGDLVLRKIEAS
ncbi:uncharacterized protein LOC141719540 [Apium graveolens]|uniref:uncharacterized protein LOC141719540 n=1 Tax=Apium graveolens TaxID=4045 RepID=UPI003D7A4D67